MQSRVNLFVLIMVVLTPFSFAQEAVTSPGKPVTAVETFPYVAQATADNINIRSGPGTQYYRCGKLNKLDRIKVVGIQSGWSRIVPPPRSFSWISKQHVIVDPNNTGIGIVVGDSVRVYAGSRQVKPIHSTTVQVKLNKGDIVGLMGEEQGDYYKIVPSAGSYLWVSTQYTEFLGTVGEVKIAVALVVESTSLGSVEAEKLREYHNLQKQIDAEKAKPIAQQDYANVKKALLGIAENKEAGKAARYAAFAIRQVKRFELASNVAKQVKLQDASLQQIREAIDKARAVRLAEVVDIGRFTVVGQFQTSSVYGEEQVLKHYRVIDESGQMTCYALPGSSALKALDSYVGRKVGLTGIIEPHIQTSSALIRFTEIVLLD